MGKLQHALQRRDLNRRCARNGRIAAYIVAGINLAIAIKAAAMMAPEWFYCVHTPIAVMGTIGAFKLARDFSLWACEYDPRHDIFHHRGDDPR